MKTSRWLRPTRTATVTAAAIVAALVVGGTAVANLNPENDGVLAALWPDEYENLVNNDDEGTEDTDAMEDQDSMDDGDWAADQTDKARAAGAIDFARDQLGKPYLWGGAGPGAFDCSGLMLKAFASVGVNIPRVTYDQWRAGQRVPRGQEQPGDLVFMRMEKRGPGHVGLVTGPGQMIHAPSRGDVVRRASYADRGDVVGFVRVASQVDGTTR